jgi:hypothetical protein
MEPLCKRTASSYQEIKSIVDDAISEFDLDFKKRFSESENGDPYAELTHEIDKQILEELLTNHLTIQVQKIHFLDAVRKAMHGTSN